MDKDLEKLAGYVPLLSRRKITIDPVKALKMKFNNILQRRKLEAMDPQKIRDTVAINVDKIENLRIQRDNARSATERNMLNARIKNLRNSSRDMVHVLQNNSREAAFVNKGLLGAPHLQPNRVDFIRGKIRE